VASSANLYTGRVAARRKKKGLTYAAAGVDIDAGDEAVRRIGQHIRRTRTPRVLGEFGGFAGMFRLDYNQELFQRNYREPVLVACTDGVGSKLLLAIEMGVHDTIGQDCVAMNVNDLIVQGAEPLFFLDYVGVHAVDPANMERIVKGVADGCKLSGCALLGGETAELPDVYDPGHYDLVGFAAGVLELPRAIDTSLPEKGDVILGLSSSGVHSNGYTLVRAIVKHAKLDLKRVYEDALPAGAEGVPATLGDLLLEPTRIYAKSITRLLRQYRVKRPVRGMAHITGGGLGGNLNRALPPELDARIDARGWEVPPLFHFLRRHGGVDEDEMWKVFNMGIGYVLLVRPHFADAVAERLTRSGETVHRLGVLTGGTGKVRIRHR